MRSNPAHKLAYIACDSFDLSSSTKTLKWTSTLSADVSLLAGALRSNTTLTTLNLDGATIAEAERTQLGKVLLDNESGVVGHCDDFELAAGSTTLRWDLKESGKARKGVPLLLGLLRANRTLTRVTLVGMGVEAVPSALQKAHHMIMERQCDSACCRILARRFGVSWHLKRIEWRASSLCRARASALSEKAYGRRLGYRRPRSNPSAARAQADERAQQRADTAACRCGADDAAAATSAGALLRELRPVGDGGARARRAAASR